MHAFQEDCAAIPFDRRRSYLGNKRHKRGFGLLEPRSNTSHSAAFHYPWVIVLGLLLVPVYIIHISQYTVVVRRRSLSRKELDLARCSDRVIISPPFRFCCRILERPVMGKRRRRVPSHSTHHASKSTGIPSLRRRSTDKTPCLALMPT